MKEWVTVEKNEERTKTYLERKMITLNFLESLDDLSRRTRAA